MSRLIIKNLPKNIKEERFRSLFGSKGEITDAKLCFTKDGKFRKFGFVGYKTEKEAKEALQHFNESFIDTSKVHVEIAKNLGDESLARPWSKHSRGSSAHEKIVQKLEKRNERKQMLQDIQEGREGRKGASQRKESNDRKGKKKGEILEQIQALDHDEGFKEFLTVHQKRSTKKVWSNDNLESEKVDQGDTRGRLETKASVAFDDSGDDDDDVYDATGGVSDKSDAKEEMDETTNEIEEENKIALDSKVSDMDYLKAKVVTPTAKEKESEDSDSEITEQEDNDANEEVEDKTVQSEESSSSDESEMEVDNTEVNKVKRSSQASAFTLKMRGLPFKAKEKDIIEFFSPLKLEDIRFIKNNKGKAIGVAFVDFSSEADVEEALRRNKDCMKNRYIELFRDSGEKWAQEPMSKKDFSDRPWIKKSGADDDEGEENIAESGRLFLRNLSYTCKEEEIQELFEKYGPLSEVHVPLDKLTNKPTGMAFVMFMMPEHAVKAFNELDGHVFQGRLLHILPAKAKKTQEEGTLVGQTSSYKKKRDMKQKSLNSSSHNWNTLFLGVNAVADAMAEKYNTTKGSILDAKSSGNLAVRMALGETQVVAETREFLTSQGVKLDVFGQPAAKRSKTVIIVKNLPFDIKPDELRETFSPFGQVGRVVLPPSGITALIEFFEAGEAKKAFQKLAYTKFKHVPLYLEWAPMDVFVTKPQQKTTEDTERGKELEQDAKTNEGTDQQSDDESEDKEGTTIFVKNLSFETTEDSLKEKFSAIGPLIDATIAKKKDPKKPGSFLSMGYGFVEFKRRADAEQSLKDMQFSMLDGHALELKMSNRKKNEKVSGRKLASSKKQKSSKLLIRNVPFEATRKELLELFSTFGEIKTLRLPKKLTGTGSHRGFAFVDFLTKQDAKRAFEALCSSTHLYGRRLVLEWAEDEDSVEALRKRTAEHFHGTAKKAKKKKDIEEDLLASQDT